MIVYTADDLIDSIKRNAVIPSSQRKFSDDDFLAFLNEELQLMLTGELMKLNEDFFIDIQYTPLVASTSYYAFPKKSAGWRIKDIYWLDPMSLAYVPLQRLPLDYIGRYQYSPSDRPLYICVGDNYILTIPEMAATVSGGLIFMYERLQNKLVKEAECGKVTGVTPVAGGYQLNVTSLPTGYTNGCDIIGGTASHEVLLTDVVPVAAPLLLTFTSVNFLRAPVIGDWVAQTGDTPIAHIPAEYNVILSNLAAIRCCAASGDDKSMGTLTALVNAEIQKLKDRSMNRIKGSAIKIRTKDRVLNMMRGRMW
jgi:hypothetical protein